MKNSTLTALLIAALFLVPNAALAGFDQMKQVGKTVVQVEANGSDTEWITGAHKNEAEALARFASTYNEIAYKSNLSPEQIRKELSAAAIKAINQQSSDFKGQFDVSFSPVIGSNVPALKMNIYPQTTYGYRFEVTFAPQS